MREARRETIIQAIERTEREVSEPWKAYGIRCWYDLTGSKGDFAPAKLSAEARERLERLREKTKPYRVVRWADILRLSRAK